MTKYERLSLRLLALIAEAILVGGNRQLAEKESKLIREAHNAAKEPK